MPPVYNCKIEVIGEKATDEVKVVYHDIHKNERPGTIRVTDIDKKLLERFDYWVGIDKLDEREDLELLGLFLYSLLFPPGSNIRQEFESNYDFLLNPDEAPPGSRLRLSLIFHKEVGALANYPWEFLFMPPRKKMQDKPTRPGFFLAGQKTDLILTRFMPDVEHRLGELEKELRILLILSNPRDDVYRLPDINTPETQKVISTIKNLEQKGSVRVRVLWDPTYEGLGKAIQGIPDQDEEAFRPHIVHFIGHGDKQEGLALQMRKEEIKKLAEAKQPPRAAWCNRKTIIDLFSDDPPPRLVFLHACNCAKPETLEIFSDLARELVSASVPAVIAMQYEIKPNDAAILAEVFYKKLADGYAIDEAVRAGREALGAPEHGGKGSWSDRRFGTPVLYLQSEKAIIEMPQPDPFDPNQRVPCPNPKCEGSKIPLGSVICPECQHDVGLCPTCKQRKRYHLMDKTKGICSRCGYRSVVIQAAKTPPSEAPTTEKDEALPTAKPQAQQRKVPRSDT